MLPLQCLLSTEVLAASPLKKEISRKHSKEAININNQSIYPKTSIGISIYPDDGDTIDILINNADKAMYSAKVQGKNRYYFYNNV